MNRGSKGRGRPMPDASETEKIVKKLEETLTVDKPFTINYSKRVAWEVSMHQRDGAVRNIRFIKIYFDLPQSFFFSAVSFLDGFLSNMMVNPRFLECLTLSCLNISVQIYNLKISLNRLIFLSKSRCSAKDVHRMNKIVIKKLNLNSVNSRRNCFDFLLMYINICRRIASYLEAEKFFNRILEEQQLYTKLEILVCDSTCATYSPVLLPLVLIELEMKQFLAKEYPNGSSYYSSEINYFLSFVIEFQSLAKRSAIIDQNCSSENIRNVLNNYNKGKKYPKIQSKPSSPIRLTLKNDYSTELHTVMEE